MTRAVEQDDHVSECNMNEQFVSPADHGTTQQDPRANDNTHSDPMSHVEGTKKDGLGSRIEDSQCIPLERDTQIDDELNVMFQEVTKPKQLSNAAIQDAGRALESSHFSIPAIERPIDFDLEDSVSGFRFSKAQHAQINLRHPGKVAISNPNSNSTADPPHKLAQAMSTPVAISESDLPCPSITKTHSKDAENRKNLETPVQRTNPEPYTSADIRTLKVTQLLPNIGQTFLPLNSSIYQAHQPSEQEKAPTDSVKGTGPAKDLQDLPSPPAKSRKHWHKEVHQQQIAKVIEANDSALPKGTLLHHQKPAPRESVTRAATKSNKARAMNPPFPEVDLPPDRRMNTAPAPKEQYAASYNDALPSFDSNRKIPDSAANNKTVRQFGTATNASSHRGALYSLSHKGLDKTQAAATTQDDPDGSWNPDIQINTAESCPAAPDHHIENGGDERDQCSPPPRQGLNPDHRDQVEEVVSPGFVHGSHIGTAIPGNPVDIGSDPYFQPPSESQSRPQSALSNTARTRSRPLVMDEQQTTGVSEAGALNNKHPMKGKKSSRDSSRNTRSMNLHSQVDTNYQNPLAAISSLRAFFHFLPGVEEVLKGFEDQQSVLESQQAEINKLSRTTQESKKQIQSLLQEKMTLTAKIKKFTEISAKYKAHMNDVVLAQKHLMNESKEFKIESAKIQEEAKAALKARADREIIENRIKILIRGVKDMRPSTEKLELLEKEIAEGKTVIENLKRSNALLQSELDMRLLDLSRERHNTEQLQKSVNVQSEAHKELVATLNKLQSAIIEELTKGGSSLENIANSENSIAAKIEELSTFTKTLSNREPELSPALVTLINDLYTRIEEKINLSETRQSTLNESGLKLSEDLQERINDLRLDGDMKSSLNERISELREANAALTASRIARDLECDEMAKRIAELGQELSSCRDKLTARSDELAAILALPKENPILIGKIHELEVAKTMLQSQLSTAKQEASKATEDLRSCQEIVLNTRKRYQELECKVIEGRTTIHRLEEEKKKLLAIHKAEVDHACQEIAKSANAAKTEVKLQYDCRVKNLEQLRSEAERELAFAREELQKIQEERASHKNNLKKFQEELSTCKKQMAQQSAHITRADKRLPTLDELERREGRLQEAITGIAEMKTKFEAVQGQTSQKIRDAIISHQIETESLIRRIDALENEKILLEGQNSDMQKSQDIFKANVIRRLRETGILATKQSIDDWASMTANTPRQMEPPLVPISKSITAQQPSSAASDSLMSQTGSGDDETLSHGVPGTPSKASQQNELSIKSALERAKAVEAKVAKSDLTPSSYQGLHVAPATFPASPAEPSPPYQGTSKALRPANRKPSSLVQSLKVAQSTTTIERNTYKVTSLDFLPSKTEDRSVATQRPRDLAPQSGQPHVPMAQISRFVHPPHVEKPVNSYEATAGNEEQIRTTQATPRSRRLDLSYSSSPLSEVDSVDLLGYEEGLFQVGPDTMSSKNRASAHKKDIGRLRHESAHIAADSIAGIKYKEIPVSHQFPDEVDISGVDASRPLILSTTDESTRRRKPQQLKSALKKTLKTGSSCNVTLADVCKIPTSENPTSSKNTPRTTVSKLHPPARLGITGSSYNRVASSSKSGSTSHMAVVSSTVQRALASGKGTPGDVERSPLMGAPKRNSRKRSASEATSQPVKPFKQLRLSLPNQGRTESQTIIPDSQE